MAVLTISRQMGSLGDDVALALSRKLGWELMTRDKLIKQFFQTIASSHDMYLLQESARFYLSEYAPGQSYKHYLEQVLRSYAQSHDAVIVGSGSQVILADHPDALHVRMIAPQPIRLARVRELYHVSEQDAGIILDTADKKHRRFVRTVFDVDSADPEIYDLVLNTAILTPDICVASILALLQEQRLRRQRDQQIARQTAPDSGRPEIINRPDDQPVFKNDSEAEFARILDMYQIDWVYEPKTFPIEWDAEGNVTLAFSPDFYLTRFDTYIELTTMNQKYVTLKNKKARKLRELYPEINVKIVYKKDFQSLIERFRQR